MIPEASDGDLDERRPGTGSRTAGVQRAVAERSACRTSVRASWAVIGPAGVRPSAAGVAFIICCACLYAAPPGLAPALPTGARAPLRAAPCRVAVARPADFSHGLWTGAIRRLRVPRISVRRFRTRLAYSANTCSTRQTGRYSYRPADALAGDIELNPGPDAAPLVAPPGTLTLAPAGGVDFNPPP